MVFDWQFAFNQGILNWLSGLIEHPNTAANRIKSPSLTFILHEDAILRPRKPMVIYSILYSNGRRNQGFPLTRKKPR